MELIDKLSHQAVYEILRTNIGDLTRRIRLLEFSMHELERRINNTVTVDMNKSFVIDNSSGNKKNVKIGPSEKEAA